MFGYYFKYTTAVPSTSLEILTPFDVICFSLLKTPLNKKNYPISCSRDSIVGIVTGYGLDDREVGVWVPVGSRIFSTSSRPALGPTQPPIQWLLGLYPRVVKLTIHLLLVPRSKKYGSIHPLPPYTFMAQCLISDNFTFNNLYSKM
jgi:hypothetical protein